MAKAIDETKMHRINQAAMELIVDKGYGGASISAIAKKAGVAEGYLYRFHPSKESFVNDLLYQKISSILRSITESLSNNQSVAEVYRHVLDIYFNRAASSPIDLKFLYILMNDYNFQVSQEQRGEIKNIIHQFQQKGMKTGEIGNGIIYEEIFNLLVSYPIGFINQRFKGFFGVSGWTDIDKQRICTFCLNALK